MHLPSSVGPTFLKLSSAFTPWTAFRMAVLTVGMILSRGRHTITAALRIVGALAPGHFSAYHKYMKDFGVAVQFCLAHLIRDVKFLLTLTDQVTRNYGRRWCERIWTVIATCTQQGRSVFEYLRGAINAHLRGQPILSLIPVKP